METQVLVGEPGACRLAKPLPSIQVPATVQAVLAARIDRLRPEEKQLLQTAAVIGLEVLFALLRAMAEAHEEAHRMGLTRLQAAYAPEAWATQLQNPLDRCDAVSLVEERLGWYIERAS